MPHFPKPFFKQGRGVWYVEIDRVQHNLGPDERAAFERYHDLMRDRPREADPSLALGVIDAFLTWARENKADRTYEWYQRHLQVFARSIPPLLSTGQLKKFHLTACLQAARAERKQVLYERRKALYKLARTHGRKYSLYHFRHTWCQRALQAGVDPLTVAILMGHHDPSTIAKVYQHLALDPDFLRKAIVRATGSGS